MPEGFLLNLLPDSKIIEQQYLNYIFKNPTEVYAFSEDYFLNIECKILIKSIKKLLENNLAFTLDEVTYFCKKEDNNFDTNIINEITTRNIENINHVKDTIKENKLKHNTILKLENVMLDATSKGEMSFEKLSSNINELYNSIHDLDKVDLKTSDEIVDNYIKVLENRKTKEVKRTLCYYELDNIITKPAAPQQMTAIVGMTGGAKTTLAKNIELKAVSKNIPVVSINLENSEEDCTDILMCITANLPLQELMQKDMNPRMEARIKRDLESFRNLPHYLTYTEPDLSLSGFDALLYKAEKIFREKGVFKNGDDYYLVIIDLAEMIDEYSESKTTYEIKNVLNKIHKITRKHKNHTILLIQSNENKIRNGKGFKKSDDLDYYKIGMEDIEGSSAISKRCRVVMTLTRPLQMKKRFFPEEMERWNFEVDVINCNIVKQNQGPEGFVKFTLNKTFRIYPFDEFEGGQENDS